MKHNIKSFILGAATTAIIGACTISAVAASGLINISVNPDIQIKVNGSVFQPKDVNGKDVMVFTYDGTTYAPLRALAEAYGLEVGWDQAAKMATVGEGTSGTASSDSASDSVVSLKNTTTDKEYEQFKEYFELIRRPIKGNLNSVYGPYYDATLKDSYSMEDLKKYSETSIEDYSIRMLEELHPKTDLTCCPMISFYANESNTVYPAGEIFCVSYIFPVDGSIVGSFRFTYRW